MDISLYNLALSVKRPPEPMPVGAATLLSLVGSVIDLLVEQQISATLWLKLPPGKIWLSEIQRYHKEVDVSDGIYNYNFYTENSEDGRNKFQKHLEAPIVPVRLISASQLRREYFLLVMSPQFCGLILAHRPCRRQQTGARKQVDQKRTQPLLAVCSFDRRVIQRVLDGIKQAIILPLGNTKTGGQRYTNSGSQSQTIPLDLTANWDSGFNCPPAPDPVLLGQLLAKQIQQHDKIRRTTTTERAVATLNLQNQELLNTVSRKDEFLKNLCQELRTPLTTMKTALSLLNSPQLKPAQRQRYLQLLNTECDRQSSLITGLLDLVQLDRVAEQTTLKPVRLSDIVPGVVSTYQPLAQEKGVMLAYTVPSELPPISCSGSWLKQIVINLLHNSIKFTSSGGQVWVRSRLQGDYVQLEFRDTGIGIASSEIPKIFDRFYRIRPTAGEEAGGAGLGLTVVQQLLLRCGGSISVKSKLGEGSIFNVLLPVASMPTSKARVSPDNLS